MWEVRRLAIIEQYSASHARIRDCSITACRTILLWFPKADRLDLGVSSARIGAPAFSKIES